MDNTNLKLLSPKAICNSETADSDSEFADSDTTVKVNPETYPQYIYYRLFTNGIGITSRQPAVVENPYLGQVARNSISPPQTVLQFKRRLCSFERITDFASSSLYLSASNKSPMDDGDRIPALGSTIDNPMELVVEISHLWMTEKTSKAYPNAQYIYYCLYTEDGVIEPKKAFKTSTNNTPSIARINKNLIPPVHNLDAVIRCISYVEGFSPCVWHQIFTDLLSELPINDMDVWGMQNGCPGSLPERPLVFVKSAEMKQCLGGMSRFTRLYRPDSTTVNIETDRKQLYTDGVVRREVLSREGKCDVYRACTDIGERGFVMTSRVYMK